MAAFFDPRRAAGRSLNEDQVIQLLGDGNFSDIEDFEDDDDEIQPSTFENLQLDDPEPEPQPSVAPEPEPMQDTPGPSQLLLPRHLLEREFGSRFMCYVRMISVRNRINEKR
ncbi:unnamed protein product [Parnassius apollo]|uniref:(apollo) hypothetical protein n=1 Tax=Parnassius apollo TaxID=110799 RepID=A0A8S3WNK5_PARAO|nr:unnamed protein product [Parnassius apollo]